MNIENLKKLIEQAQGKSANEFWLATGRRPTDVIVELAQRLEKAMAENNELKPKLKLGDTVYLNDGDQGVVNHVCDNGYELLMDSTGKYHSVHLNGDCGMFGDPVKHAVDWAKTCDSEARHEE